MKNNYEKINLEETNCKGCGDDHKLEEQMEAIRRENQGILNVAFSLTAICVAIIAGAAVAATTLA